MRRLTHCNAMANREARERLYALGCIVKSQEWHEAMLNHGCLRVQVKLESSGETIGDQTFAHYDDDVLYNTATAWMNGLAEALESWK